MRAPSASPMLITLWISSSFCTEACAADTLNEGAAASINRRNF